VIGIGDQVTDQRGSDEPRTPGDKYPQAFILDN
jgi:hypothetical protein